MDENFKYNLEKKEALENKKIKEDEKSAVTYGRERKLISDADRDILAHPSSRIVSAVFTTGAVGFLIYCIAANLGLLIIIPSVLLLVLVPLTIVSFLSYRKAKKSEKKDESYFSNLKSDMREHIIKIEQSIKKRETIKMYVTIFFVFSIFAAFFAGVVVLITSLGNNPDEIPILGIAFVGYFVFSIISILIYSAFSGRKSKKKPTEPKIAEGAVYSRIVSSEINGRQKFRVLVAVLGVDSFLTAVSENNVRYEKGEAVMVEYDAANLRTCKIIG